MRPQKGSFTIEAVILIPVLICLMLAVLRQGIEFYEEFAQKEISEELIGWDAADQFYKVWILKELKEVIEDE